jgi:hypothetical protein
MVSVKKMMQTQMPLSAILCIARNLIFESESATFGLVIVLIAVVRFIVLALGFVSVSADEYARILFAADWAESPYFINRYLGEISDVWQPLHFCLLGIALKIHNGDLFLTSRVFTMVFSLISFGMFYLLLRKLFNRWVALLSVLIVGFLPAHVYLSLTPMVDVILVTGIISFLFFFFVWLDNRADRYLLLAALMLGLASGLRYDGWFAVTIFVIYIGLYWLIGLWTTHSLRPLWLLSIGLACLLVCMWLVGNYVYWNDPFHFLEGHKGSGDAVREIGPLTNLFPSLGYVELLLQSGAFICWLAIWGIIIAYSSLGSKVLLYLIFSLTPFVILVLRGGTPGNAYRPHYPFPYLVLLTPFCAYTIYWAITASKQSLAHHWQVKSRGMLVVVSLYNLWLVYVRFSGQHSWVLVSLLALAGIALSYRLLDHKYWFYWALSLSPLLILMILSKGGLASELLYLCTGLYFVLLVVFYAYNIWRVSETIEPASHLQWRMAGLGILVIISFYNLWGTFSRIPQGMPAGVNEAGLLVRQFFEDGTLTDADKVLVEVVGWNFLAMQVMSNHPGNFVLDRAIQSDQESFLLDKNSSPHEIGAFFTSYEERVNPFSLDPSLSLDGYLKNERIRLAIIKDPRLESLLGHQTEFEKIAQVEDYVFYFARKGK